MNQVTPCSDGMEFNEERGQVVADLWFVSQMTAKNPPSVKDLFTNLHEALEPV